jgi:hypothetical protein
VGRPTTTQGRLNGNVRAAKWAAFAAILVGLGGNTTIYLDGRAARSDAREARAERIARENQFFRAQCFRDRTFSLVIVQALEDAKRRAEASISDPVLLAQAVGAIQRSIDQLRILAGACAASIPD